MKTLRFGTKVYLGLGILVTMAMVMGGTGVKVMSELSAIIDNLKDRQFAQINAASEANQAFLQMYRDLLKHTLADSTEDKKLIEEDFQKHRTSALDGVKKLKEIGLTKKGEELISQVINEIEEGKAPREKMMQLSSQGRGKEAYEFMVQEVRPAYDKIENHLNKFIQLKQAQVEQVNREAEEIKAVAHKTFIVLLLIGLAASIGVAWIIASAVRSLVLIVEDLRGGSVQVATAASQIAGASQDLSSTANEQASAIEQTSASLEELSGMVENNVKGAESSTQLAEQVRQSSERGNNSMDLLIRSMDEILESNRKIEQLVKVIAEIGEKTEIIDEIVFQTKLLSFNASVEAERAGEHGRGFAVVAQEVGNLAQMSGKAALEISGIVKNSIKYTEEITAENKQRVEKGNSLASNTAETLAEAKKSAEQMLEAARQIANASREQATGIRQINLAVESLSKATQQTSATAEQATSASEELDAQALSMKSLVMKLDNLVNAKGGSETPNTLGAPRQPLSSSANAIPITRVKEYRSQVPQPIQPLKKAVGDELRAHGNQADTSAQDGWEKL